MTVGKAAWKKAGSSLNNSLSKDLNLRASGHANNALSTSPPRPTASPRNGGGPSVTAAVPPRCAYTSISKAEKDKKSADRDFLVSILETSVTKRDAKGYINKFVPLLERKGVAGFKQRTAQTRQNDTATASSLANPPATSQEPLHVALVKFRLPQQVNEDTIKGVGKTLSQLQKLGLISIVVLDCDHTSESESVQRQIANQQATRLAMAIDQWDTPGARVIDSPLTIGDAKQGEAVSPSPLVSGDLFISNAQDLMSSLQDDHIPIITSFGLTADTCTIKAVNPDEAVLALARQLSGLQFAESTDGSHPSELPRPAEVYRLIILDPLGGIPATNRATGRHLFLNLEQQFEEVAKHLKGDRPADSSTQLETRKEPDPDNIQHLENAALARNVLSMLPPTSSAVITTPQEVARELKPGEMDWAMVSTRRGQNPLIHNLLTDKPVRSSSLPTERFKPITSSTGTPQIGSLTTLAKKGMPVTIYPDPRSAPWRPPQPGQPVLSLTDPCIDLPRLVHLIEDSFGRKLDVDDYLKRIQGNLAGVIIAGEYEGGALLTWERPAADDMAEGKQQPRGDSSTSDPERLVPYLDKFAVLRKSQGAGGVADIVFNAMVRDCFPDGVCWRSRKDNPVNKWYFERSRGTLKFPDMNWTMFWTTPGLALDQRRLRDYESVCRSIQPSWADKKHILD